MLSDKYSKKMVRNYIARTEEFKPFPTIVERSAWSGLPAKTREKRIRNAEKYRNYKWPGLVAVRYMDFVRNGNRSKYENIFFERRRALGTLVIAECIEGEGRFMDDIVNGIWSICEESAWCVPAHNRKAGSPRPERDPLPDVEEPVIDLHSGETAALLAWTRYLLKTELDRISPLISKRIKKEIDHRIMKPYMKHNDFNWMGFNSGIARNWCPWCNSNCITSYLLLEDDQDKKADVIKKSLQSVDIFLKGYYPDGGCDEGPMYWNFAAGSLFVFLELLYLASDGRINFYDEPKIKSMAGYIYKVHISNNYYVNFSDSPAKVDILPYKAYLFGRRTDNNPLCRHGAAASKHSIESNQKFYPLFINLMSFFYSENIEEKTDSFPCVKDVWLADTQVMTAREKNGSDKGFFLAAKAGHNGEGHNHNDIGQFMVYYDGKPVIIDAGVGTYTSKTFNPKTRYKIWTMQSSYHNLPEVSGVQQSYGKEYHAKDVYYKSDNDLAQISMDISKAYPEQSGIIVWKRTCSLNRADNPFIQINDNFELDSPVRDLKNFLLTPCDYNIKPGKILLYYEKNSYPVCILFSKNKLDISVETINLEDKRLSNIWGNHLYRIIFKVKKSVKHGKLELKFIKE